jgi:nitroreductase
MRVSEAIAARRSVRGFTDKPVDIDLVERLLIAASRAPSGGNLQPWHVDVMTGEPLAAFKQLMARKLMAGEVETPEYPIYPPELDMQYKDRRFAVGEAMYGHIGIPREDKTARRMWFARNFAFFGAPLAFFISVGRGMGSPQWSDLGMFLQNFMLLAVEEGLATCPQECWAMYPQTVGAAIDLPPERMLFCGMAVGYEDLNEPANQLRSDRATSDQWLSIRK